MKARAQELVPTCNVFSNGSYKTPEIEVKLMLSLDLIKHYAIKTYVGLEV
jgi:hypothetical protein